ARSHRQSTGKDHPHRLPPPLLPHYRTLSVRSTAIGHLSFTVRRHSPFRSPPGRWRFLSASRLDHARALAEGGTHVLHVRRSGTPAETTAGRRHCPWPGHRDRPGRDGVGDGGRRTLSPAHRAPIVVRGGDGHHGHP